MNVVDYSKRQLKSVRFPIWRALIETTRKWLRSLVAINIQVKQHYCTMLVTASGNCDVTKVAYNENKYYAVTWIVYLESFMYLRRRQWLPGIPLLGNLSLDWEFQQRLGKNLGNWGI